MLTVVSDDNASFLQRTLLLEFLLPDGAGAMPDGAGAMPDGAGAMRDGAGAQPLAAVAASDMPVPTMRPQ